MLLKDRTAIVTGAASARGIGKATARRFGGASLFGGRGSFLGVLFSALVIQEVNSATTFLGLSQPWQYWFIGLLTLCAVAVYSQARQLSNPVAG